MNKPKVLFPYVEAGMGHIVPMRAIAKKFKEMYGDCVDCVETNFFADSGNKAMQKFEEKMRKTVVDSNKHGLLGETLTVGMYVFGPKLSEVFAVDWLQRGIVKASVSYMESLAPDMVVSTHYSTNYFARKCSPKPLTAVFCPDSEIYPMFSYPSDLTLIATQAGYEKALKNKRRFNADNLRKVKMAIRPEAYGVTQNKAELRAELGLAPDKFTVLLAEGGYGIGKMTEICRTVLKKDLPVNLVPVCGRNEKLYREMLTWQSKGNCVFSPVGFTDRMLEYMACSDLFCGKSGANVFVEATFFGVPQIVTKYATLIEKLNGEYYCKTAKTALKIFNAHKAVQKITEFIDGGEQYVSLKKAAEAQKNNYGAEEAARQIYSLLCERFGSLPKNI